VVAVGLLIQRVNLPEQGAGAGTEAGPFLRRRQSAQTTTQSMKATPLKTAIGHGPIDTGPR
jgi:hypothetical protein